jgi:hypothetical protein
MKTNVFEVEELTTIFFHKDTQLNIFIQLDDATKV